MAGDELPFVGFRERCRGVAARDREGRLGLPSTGVFRRHMSRRDVRRIVGHDAELGVDESLCHGGRREHHETGRNGRRVAQNRIAARGESSLPRG